MTPASTLRSSQRVLLSALFADVFAVPLAIRFRHPLPFRGCALTTGSTTLTPRLAATLSTLTAAALATLFTAARRPLTTLRVVHHSSSLTVS